MNTYAYTFVEARTLAPSVRAFLLQPKDTRCDFLPGQYVEVHLPEGQWVPVSLAHAPQASGELQVHLRVEAHLPLSIAVATALSQSTIELRGPLGNAILGPTASQQSLGFVAGGTGIAPHLSLLAAALPDSQAPRTLFWGIRAPEDAYVMDTLDAWAETYPHFAYTLVLSGSDPHWLGQTGWVHEVARAHFQTTPVDACFASGPYPMVTKLRDAWLADGFAPSALRSDMLPQD